MLKITRKTLSAAVVLALAGGAAWAADEKMAGSMDMGQCVSQAADKMKMMAADPAKMSMMTDEMAKMMVMDKMSMKIAMDPQCKQTLMSAMEDPNVKKAHEAAMAMAKDSEQSKKIMEQVMNDPMAMKSVIHSAGMMAMMKGDMGGMKDKMQGMGGKMDHEMK